MGIKVGYVNILETAASVTATSSATNYPLYRLYDRMFGLFWQAASAATTQIMVDQGTANIQPADTLIIPANHNLAGLNLVWQVSNDYAAWATLIQLDSTGFESDFRAVCRSRQLPVPCSYDIGPFGPTPDDRTLYHPYESIFPRRAAVG